MITKQKLKSLEDALNNLRGEKTFCAIKKYDEELYSYQGKVYKNLDIAETKMDLQSRDNLVIVTDYGSKYFPK